MAKLNLDKLTNFEPVRPERQSDVRSGQSAPIRPTRSSYGAGGKDRVDVSGKASEVGKFVSHVKELPDVRAEMIAEAKLQVASGAFNPSAVEIADAIFKEEQS